MTQMLCSIWPNGKPDIRDMIVQFESTAPVHEKSKRPTPEDIESRYRIDTKMTRPAPERIAIVDDVLTTGAHFRAAQNILLTAFPKARIVGLFLARRNPRALLNFEWVMRGKG